MRIKHTGQNTLPTNPKHDAGRHHAEMTKRAVCNLGQGSVPTFVYASNVPVTTKRRRRIAAPAVV